MITALYVFLIAVGNGIGIALLYWFLTPRARYESMRNPRPNIRKDP